VISSYRGDIRRFGGEKQAQNAETSISLKITWQLLGIGLVNAADSPAMTAQQMAAIAGNAAPMRTPTACCVSFSPRE